MAKIPTYALIGETTLSATSAAVIFSSIPSTFTDLIFVGSNEQGITGTPGIMLRFNSDSSTNYSQVTLEGKAGTTSRSSSGLNGTNLGGTIGLSATANQPATTVIYIQEYASTFNYKTAIVNHAQPMGTAYGSMIAAYTWKNTSAITNISVTIDGGNIPPGATFRLFGIKAGR